VHGLQGAPRQALGRKRVVFGVPPWEWDAIFASRQQNCMLPDVDLQAVAGLGWVKRVKGDD